ncbi:hypothetical protein Mapa_017685 [Marchantia paleacea]|nr:hypothetical protein Mapa_017685 [Marchantia paleacea]
MADEEAPKVQMNPADSNPLVKLALQIELKKYEPSRQESEVLGKCVEDAKWYYMNGPLAAGALVWSFTGGTRLKIVPRILMTASAAVVGNDFGLRIAGALCAKKILSLEGSPMRVELIAILRESNPNNPMLKKHLGEKQERVNSQTVYGTYDDMQDPSLPASHKDWATRIDDRIPNDVDSTEEQDTGIGNEELRRIPRVWRTEAKEANAKTESGDADLLADPFDLVMHTGYVEDSLDGVEGNGTGRPGKETRRSRMSTKERREYDRKQYQRWQQEQQKV